MTDAASNEKSALAKQYLESTVVPVLTQALTQMCVNEPDDPFTWLAQVPPPTPQTPQSLLPAHYAVIMELLSVAQLFFACLRQHSD